MDYGEHINFVFDREGIESTGIEPSKAFDVIEQFRLLAEHVLKYRVGEKLPYEAAMQTAFLIRLRAAPFEGSIKLPAWAVAAAGVLSVAANASQISGVTLQDAFTAIRTSQGEAPDEDPVVLSLVQHPQTDARLDSLYKAAAASDCSYVAIERGNEVAVIHGAKSANLALVASAPLLTSLVSGPPATLWRGHVRVANVFYRGRQYPIFAIDGSGHPPQQGRRPGYSEPLTIALVWGSQAPIPADAPYSLQLSEIEPRSLTHNSDLPEEFKTVQKVYLVTGASELDYR